MVDLALVSQLEHPLLPAGIERTQPVLDERRTFVVGIALVDPVQGRIGRIRQAFDLEPRGTFEDPQAAARARAEERLAAGEPEDACAILEEAFRAGGDELRTRRLWQDAMERCGRAVDARAHARRDVEIGGGADAMVLLARVSEPEDAAELLERALQLEPEHAWAHFGRGVLDARAGSLAAAEASFSTALEADPRFPEVFLRRAQVRDRRAEFDGAAEDYAAYIELRPEDLGAIDDYASILHRELQRSGDAEELYRRQLELDPGRPTATVGLAVCLEESGEFEEAEQLYLSVWDRAPSALFNLGMLYQERLHRYEEARECFRRFLTLAPTSESEASIADRLIYAPLRLEELDRILADAEETPASDRQKGES